MATLAPGNRSAASSSVLGGSTSPVAPAGSPRSVAAAATARSPASSAAAAGEHRCEVARGGYEALLAPVGEETDRGGDLGAHAAGRELAVAQVGLGLRGGHLEDGLLGRLAPVDEHVAGPGQENERVGAH